MEVIFCLLENIPDVLESCRPMSKMSVGLRPQNGQSSTFKSGEDGDCSILYEKEHMRVELTMDMSSNHFCSHIKLF